jgi:toxin FitB
VSPALKRPAQRRRPAKVRAPAAPVVLDASCWLEFFADTDRADLYAGAIEQAHALVVPVLTVYEVAKKLAREVGDDVAAAALSLMQRGTVVPIDLPLALEAAVNGLPLADSLIYATARHHGAELWTQDRHFEGLPGVRYFAKP